MGENEYVELLTCLVRVVWAAAAGKLFLASMGIQSGTQSYGNTYHFALLDSKNIGLFIKS